MCRKPASAKMHHFLFTMQLVPILLFSTQPAGAENPRPTAHWKLAGDTRDHSGHNHHLKAVAVDLKAAGPGGKLGKAAAFNGRDSFLEAAPSNALNPGKGEFSLAAWVFTDDELDDVLGDLLSKYDPLSRTGFVLNIKHNVGATASQANYRHLEFGIDDGKLDEKWTDCGRPGAAVLVYSLAAYNGQLFAGTCVAGEDQAGRVFRYVGEKNWVDCGAPDKCNAVSTLAVYNGKLYAGVSKYRLRGSALSESENPHLGGKIYRYEGNAKWSLVGTLPKVEAINGMVVFRGKLYASSMYAPAGLFRYDGNKTWTDCGSPGGKRVEAMCVYNGSLFATGYDEGAVYRYDGRTWTSCGRLADNTQTYSFAIYGGQLYVGTWRSGRVYRYAGDNHWIDVGRLGEELEVMGMAVYNGKLYAGTLPLAEVYRYDGPGHWQSTGRVDHTPDVRYRRAWTMANFQGKLFVGTLPSGHVMSIEAGKSVSYNHALPSGWVHVAAVRGAERLKLYVNGQKVAESSKFESTDFDLSNGQPLKIGLGQHDHFNGRLSDVRYYSRALNDADVAELANR